MRKLIDEMSKLPCLMLLLGNVGDGSEQRQVSYASAKRDANAMGMPYLECNTVDIDSVDLAFAKLAEECMQLSAVEQATAAHTTKSGCQIM